jgi:uncharacterized membrane protein
MKFVDIVKIAVVMIMLDVAWISIVTGEQFGTMIKTIQGSPMIVRPLGAFVAYAAMIGLFYTFKDNLSIHKAFLLGFFAYAIYDGTNYALLGKWDLQTAIVDSLWGGCLFALTRIVVNRL